MKRIVLGTMLFIILLLGVTCSTNTKTTSDIIEKDNHLVFQDNKDSIKECALTQECVITSPKGFQIKEYEGSLAVFKSGNPVPIRITSTTIDDLPNTDQELLKKGIEVSCEEDVNILLEDYCS